MRTGFSAFSDVDDESGDVADRPRCRNGGTPRRVEDGQIDRLTLIPRGKQRFLRWFLKSDPAVGPDVEQDSG